MASEGVNQSRRPIIDRKQSTVVSEASYHSSYYHISQLTSDSEQGAVRDLDWWKREVISMKIGRQQITSVYGLVHVRCQARIGGDFPNAWVEQTHAILSVLASVLLAMSRLGKKSSCFTGKLRQVKKFEDIVKLTADVLGLLPYPEVIKDPNLANSLQDAVAQKHAVVIRFIFDIFPPPAAGIANSAGYFFKYAKDVLTVEQYIQLALFFYVIQIPTGEIVHLDTHITYALRHAPNFVALSTLMKLVGEYFCLHVSEDSVLLTPTIISKLMLDRPNRRGANDTPRLLVQACLYFSRYELLDAISAHLSERPQRGVDIKTLVDQDFDPYSEINVADDPPFTILALLNYKEKSAFSPQEIIEYCLSETQKIEFICPRIIITLLKCEAPKDNMKAVLAIYFNPKRKNRKKLASRLLQDLYNESIEIDSERRQDFLVYLTRRYKMNFESAVSQLPNLEGIKALIKDYFFCHGDDSPDAQATKLLRIICCRRDVNLCHFEPIIDQLVDQYRADPKKAITDINSRIFNERSGLPGAANEHVELNEVIGYLRTKRIPAQVKNAGGSGLNDQLCERGRGEDRRAATTAGVALQSADEEGELTEAQRPEAHRGEASQTTNQSGSGGCCNLL